MTSNLWFYLTAIFERVKSIWQIKKIYFELKKKWFVEKTGSYVIEPIKMNQYWKFNIDILKMADLYDISFFCIQGIEKILIIQMHIWACYGRRIAK